MFVHFSMCGLMFAVKIPEAIWLLASGQRRASAAGTGFEIAQRSFLLSLTDQSSP
jgi:hypothetical protein